MKVSTEVGERARWAAVSSSTESQSEADTQFLDQLMLRFFSSFVDAIVIGPETVYPP